MIKGLLQPTRQAALICSRPMAMAGVHSRIARFRPKRQTHTGMTHRWPEEISPPLVCRPCETLFGVYFGCRSSTSPNSWSF